MPGFVQVATTNDLQSGQMKQVAADSQAILLARVGDNYYATQNFCPHMGGNLSKGTLSGKVVTCPRHHSQFDVTDGHLIRWTDWTGLKLALSRIYRSPRPLKTYEVKVEGDRVLVKVP